MEKADTIEDQMLFENRDQNIVIIPNRCDSREYMNIVKKSSQCTRKE